jgi:hypothetical protein
MAERKYRSANTVRLRGQRLNPIIWQGSQRAVTAYGIEALNGSYTIRKDRLDDPYWIEHMSEKEWVNVPDFADALKVARGNSVRNRGLRV